jgi:TonB family protein
MSMKIFAILLVGVLSAGAQLAKDSNCSRDEKISGAVPTDPFDVKKGEIYRSPVVSFTVSADGTLSQIRFIRGSGIRSLNAQLIREIKKWRYSSRPDCAPIRVKTAITIDWVDP